MASTSKTSNQGGAAADHDVVRAIAPASVSNLGPAFDILGFALEQPGDTVEIRRSSKPGVHITDIQGDGGRLPRESHRNTAAKAVSDLLGALDLTIGLDIRLHKGLPLCSGLGSSAASAAAAVMAANHLLGNPLPTGQLLPFVVEAEVLASGTPHADNAAPALLGGVCLARSTEPLDIVSLPFPDKLRCVIVHPHCEIRTEEARRVLPSQVDLAHAVHQWGNIAGLVAGLCLGDLELIGRSIDDTIVEPHRSQLIPGFPAVKSAALSAGALGCSISGSGPSVFALCSTDAGAHETGKAMTEALQSTGLPYDLFISPIASQGARILAPIGKSS